MIYSTTYDRYIYLYLYLYIYKENSQQTRLCGARSGSPNYFERAHAQLGKSQRSECNITSECKSLWGKPERVHRISAVNIEDECTV